MEALYQNLMTIAKEMEPTPLLPMGFGAILPDAFFFAAQRILSGY